MSEANNHCPFCGNQLVYGDVERLGVPVVTCSGCPLIIDAATARRRTPPPATKAYLDWLNSPATPTTVNELHRQSATLVAAFLLEWNRAGRPEAAGEGSNAK